MTAEIAVMNRFGVALAADSAITIGDGQNTKIYQTANKLFEVSDNKAVGLMIYNNTEFFGAPWEIVIKEFRSAHGSDTCKTLFDWQAIFTSFILICQHYTRLLRRHIGRALARSRPGRAGVSAEWHA